MQTLFEELNKLIKVGKETITFCKLPRQMMSEPGTPVYPGLTQELPAYCLGGIRHIDDVICREAFMWNIGTSAKNVKGNTQAAAPVRVKVPMSVLGRTKR